MSCRLPLTISCYRVHSIIVTRRLGFHFVSLNVGFSRIFAAYFSADLSEDTHKLPPRVFCDICDIFDAHDTDDCPIQAQDSDGPPPSHHHVERSSSRPYCDTCEGMQELKANVKLLFELSRYFLLEMVLGCTKSLDFEFHS